MIACATTIVLAATPLTSIQGDRFEIVGGNRHIELSKAAPAAVGGNG